MTLLLVAAGKLWTSFAPTRCFSISAPLSVRGVRHLRGLNLTEEEVQDLDEDETNSMLDPDLEAFQEHVSKIDVDARKFQSFIRKKTIEQKYFKQYGPTEVNLLTWAMKEQLRYLHMTDPDYWTPEVLSQAFPVSPAGAKKLAKSKWAPRNEAAIQRHDRAVMAHWKQHMKGQLGSDRLVKQILHNRSSMVTHPVPIGGTDQILSTLQSLKFESDEQPHISDTPKPKNKLPKAQMMKTGSFSSIIKDYEFKSSQLNKKYEEDPEDTASSRHLRLHDLSAITSPAPQYEGTYSQVSCGTTCKPKVRKSYERSQRKQNITFSEFIKQRNNK